MNKYIVNWYRQFSSFLFDPRETYRKVRGIPYYIRNMILYRTRTKISHMPFKISWWDTFPCLADRFNQGGKASGHYFWQDLWAARELYKRSVRNHVDVGSRLDGFIAHVLPFCKVTYVDIRTVEAEIENLIYMQGSILKMPFRDNTVSSLSSLHVLEHIGLGRYGDPIDPEGHVKAARELSRVLAEDGVLLIGTPVGRERLCFDAHRVFDPQTVVDMFEDLKLEAFSLIDDKGVEICFNATIDQARECEYGCGLFIFRKV